MKEGSKEAVSFGAMGRLITSRKFTASYLPPFMFYFSHEAPAREAHARNLTARELGLELFQVIAVFHQRTQALAGDLLVHAVAGQ